jgi:hypothetical protein
VEWSQKCSGMRWRSSNLAAIGSGDQSRARAAGRRTSTSWPPRYGLSNASLSPSGSFPGAWHVESRRTWAAACPSTRPQSCGNGTLQLSSPADGCTWAKAF